MPRTLSAEVEQARVAQAYAYDVLIEAPDIGLALSWFHEDGDLFEHRLLSIDPVEVGVPPGGGVGFVSQLSFRMAEDGTGQSILELEASAHLHNAQITLKLLFQDEDYAEAIPLFSGRIDAWEVADGEAVITAVDDRLHRNILLPRTLVARHTHPNAPDESIGQALPIVYGAGLTLAPIPLLLVDQTLHIYQVSEHANAKMIAVLGAWPQGTDRLKTIEADPAQAEVLDNNRLRLLQLLTETKFGLAIAPPEIHETVGDVEGGANILDEDPGTITRFHTTASDGVSRLVIDFPHGNPIGINTVEVQLLAHRLGPDAEPTIHGDFQLDTVKSDGTTAIEGLIRLPERRVRKHQTETHRISGIALEEGHTLRMTVSGVNEEEAAGTALDYYQVGSVIVQGYYQVSGPFEHVYLPDTFKIIGQVAEEDVAEEGVFEALQENVFQGRFDDAGGAITGSANGVFDTFPEVLASILRDELGLTVDPLTFTTAKNARLEWKAAGGVGAGWYRGRTSALDLLHSLAIQGGMYLYPRGDGTYILKPIDPLDDATFVIGPAGSDDDFLLYERVDPASDASTWRRTLRYRGGRSDTVRTQFEIHYAFHSARGTFGKLAQASWEGTTATEGQVEAGTVELLQVAHDLFGERDAYTLDADFIYDDDTAHFLLDLLVPYWAFPRHEIEFESTMAPLPLLLGESIEMDTVGMPEGMRGQPFECDRIRYDFDAGRIFLHGTARRRFRLDYYRIKDQSNAIWYWWLNGETGQVVISDAAPNFAHTIEEDITPVTIPYWLELEDETATTRYVYPHTTGQIVVSDTEPAVGTGVVDSPTWIDLRAKRYRLVAFSTGQFGLERV